MFSHPTEKGPKKARKASVGRTRAPTQKFAQGDLMALGRSVLQRKRNVQDAIAQLSAAKPAVAGWLSVPDVKTPTVSSEMVKALNEAYTSELKMAKGVLASMYGDRPVPFRMSLAVDFSSTITSGVVQTPMDVKVASAGEFTYLLELFDEYRFEKGRYEFFVITPTPTAVLATSSLTNSSMFAIGFDPADATSPPSISAVTQLQQHKLLAPRMMPTPTVGTYVGVFGRNDNEPFVFEWRVAHPDAMVTGNGGVVAPGMWKATAGNTGTFPDGTIKVLYQSGETTAKVSVSGQAFYDILLRSRT